MLPGCGVKIINTLGDGARYKLNIKYSNEGKQALETGGGIFNALPLLGEDPFLVLNADIWTDFPLAELPEQIEGLAPLVLVDKPEHHAPGEFAL